MSDRDWNLEPDPNLSTSPEYNRGWADGNASALDACNPVVAQLQTRIADLEARDTARDQDLLDASRDPDLHMRRAEARALAADSTTGGLDAAWGEVQKVLPEGWCLHLFDYGAYGPFNPPPGKPFGSPHVEASARDERAEKRWAATAQFGIESRPPHIMAREETPTAALQALTRLLAAANREPEAKEGE